MRLFFLAGFSVLISTSAFAAPTILTCGEKFTQGNSVLTSSTSVTSNTSLVSIDYGIIDSNHNGFTMVLNSNLQRDMIAFLDNQIALKASELLDGSFYSIERFDSDGSDEPRLRINYGTIKGGKIDFRETQERVFSNGMFSLQITDTIFCERASQ